MSRGHIVHNSVDCHKIAELPKENQYIIITTHDDKEFSLGYYDCGKWFKVGHIEIDANEIKCWHYE